MSLHCNGDNIYLFINGKEIFKFKANKRNVNFPTQFCLGSISDWFDTNESWKVFLKGIAYDFSFDYNSIDKCDILTLIWDEGNFNDPVGFPLTQKR